MPLLVRLFFHSSLSLPLHLHITQNRCIKRSFSCSALDMTKKSFEDVLQRNSWNTIDLRDNRYNQVIHLITAANGAEDFYNTEDNPCRTEPPEIARELDTKTMESWVGHPYIDILDNSTDFDTKITRMIEVSISLAFRVTRLELISSVNCLCFVLTVCLSTDRH